jgi:hypothetical protein
MRFDKAFEILVEHCARVSPIRSAATGHAANSARTSTYGNDIWITGIVRSYYTSRIDQNTPTAEHFILF